MSTFSDTNSPVSLPAKPVEEFSYTYNSSPKSETGEFTYNHTHETCVS